MIAVCSCLGPCVCFFFPPAYGVEIREGQCWKTGLLPCCSSGKLSSRSQTFLSFRTRRAGFFQPWGPPTGSLVSPKSGAVHILSSDGRQFVPVWTALTQHSSHFAIRSLDLWLLPSLLPDPARPNRPARLRLTADLQRTLIQSPNRRRSNRKQILGTEYQRIRPEPQQPRALVWLTCVICGGHVA